MTMMGACFKKGFDQNTIYRYDPTYNLHPAILKKF